MSITEDFDPASFDWWQARQRGETPPANPDTPMTGFYRGKGRDGKSDPPVAFWYDGDQVVCLVGGSSINADGSIVGGILVADTQARSRWNFLSERHISHDVYQRRIVSQRWDNEPEPVPLAPNAQPSLVPLTPVEGVRQALAGLVTQAATYALLKTQQGLEQAQTVRANVLKAKREAVAQFTSEAKPHKDALGKVTDNWKPLIDKLEGLNFGLRREIERFLASDLKARQDAADAAGRSAQAAAVSNPREVIGANQPPEPIPVAPRQELPSQIRGAVGRASSVKPKWVADFTDWDQDQVYQHYRGKDKLIQFLKMLAHSDIEAGLEVPGVKRIEGVKVR